MEKAKAIHVSSLENQKIELLDLHKDQVLLILFYNNQCLGCTGRAIPLAYEFQQEFSKIKVIGIHSNFSKRHQVNKEDILSIFTKKEVPFPIYLDQDHSVYDLYECEGTPHWFLINSAGEVYRSVFGSQHGAKNRLLYAMEELLEEEQLN